MGRKASKANDNIFYLAREEAMSRNHDFSSREKASAIIGMDRTRLARIELSEIQPYPDEVKQIAKAYDKPELCYQYCSEVCLLGKQANKKASVYNLDRLVLNTLGSLNHIASLKDLLITISSDGKIDEEEKEEFSRILNALLEISQTAQSLELWAMKNLKK